MNQARLLGLQNVKMCLLSEWCKNVQGFELNFSPFAFVMHKCFLSAPIIQTSLHSFYLYFVHYFIILKKYDLRLNQNQAFQLKTFTWQKQFWIVQEGTLVLYNMLLLWLLCIPFPVFPLHSNKTNLQLNIYVIRHSQFNYSGKTQHKPFLTCMCLQTMMDNNNNFKNRKQW